MSCDPNLSKLTSYFQVFSCLMMAAPNVSARSRLMVSQAVGEAVGEAVRPVQPAAQSNGRAKKQQMGKF